MNTITCPTCATAFAAASGASEATCPRGHRFAVVPEAAPVRRYYVARSAGRDFIQTATPGEIRASLAAGAFRAHDWGTESDGRSFDEFLRAGGGGRWRMLAELLAEWGEPLPTPAPRAPSAAWYVTPCAALAGASSCLLLATFSVAMMHAIAFLDGSCCGLSTSAGAFYRRADSLLLDLIILTVAAAFGAIRGVVHADSMTDLPRGWRAISWAVAGKAADDLAHLRGPHQSFGHGVEIVGSLFLAMILAFPVIFLLLVLWLR
jgi:hypothetical protein